MWKNKELKAKYKEFLEKSSVIPLKDVLKDNFFAALDVELRKYFTNDEYDELVENLK